MKLDDSKRLDALIKEGNLPGLVLLWGEDAGAVIRTRKKLEKLTVTAFPDFNSYRCDGRFPVDLDALGDSVRSLPMMAPRRFALIEDLNPAVLGANDTKKLEQLFQEIPEETLLVITMYTVLPNFKKKGDKGAAFCDLCDKHGAVCSFLKPRETQAVQQIMAEAERTGSVISQRDARLLSEYCGREPLRMAEETRKLAAHSPEGITREDIEALVTPVTEARSFDLADRILSRDYTAALGVIDDLIFLRETPISILTTLTMSFTDMHRAAVAKKAGIPDAEARKAYGYASAYRYEQGIKNQRKFSLPALEDILELLADADSRSKSSGVDPQVVLETTVAEIFRRMERG